MNSLIKALALFCLLVSSLQAKHFDHDYKSAFKHKKHHLAKIIHKVKKKIHEHKKCGNITAKSLRDLKKSKKIQIVEDESSIEITSSCPITLLPKIEFDQDKILVISAPDLKIQNHAEINATRIILNIADKLDIKKHAKLCAEVIVLEAPRGKYKANACDGASVIGSLVGIPSVQALLEVAFDSTDIAPAMVHFTWDNSFGVFTESELHLGNGEVIITTDTSFSYEYTTPGTYEAYVVLKTDVGDVSSERKQIVILGDVDPGENINPTVNQMLLSYNSYPIIPLEVYAEFSDFSDADGHVVGFEVDWGDGTITTSSTFNMSHYYEAPGEYTIKGRVIDDRGGVSAWIEKSLTLYQYARPEITHVPVYSADINAQAPVQVGFAPWEGTINEGWVESWSYDFGDGSPIIETPEGYMEHTYFSNGFFSVTINAYSVLGLASSYTFTLDLSGAPAVTPILTTQVIKSDAPAVVNFDWSQSLGNYTSATIDFGDGEQLTTTETAVEKTYYNPGVYIAKLYLHADSGTFESDISYINVEETTNLPPSGTFLCDNSQSLKLICQAANLQDDKGIANVRFETQGTTLFGENVTFEDLTVGFTDVTMTITDNEGAQYVETKSFEVLDPSLIAGVTCNQEGGNYFLCFIPQQPAGIEIAKIEWFINDVVSSSEYVLSHYFEAVGNYQIKVIVTDSNLETVVSETSVDVTVIDTFPEAPVPELSLGTLAITEPESKPFYAINESIILTLSDESFRDDESGIDVNLNGQSLDAFTVINSNQIMLNTALLDGKNIISIEAYDSQDHIIQQEYEIYAGSRTVSFNLDSSFDSAVNMIIDPLLGEQIHLKDQVLVNGSIILQNVPTTIPFGLLFNSLEVQETYVLKAGAEDVLVNISGKTIASHFNNDNLDFAQGDYGWILDHGESNLVENVNDPNDFLPFVEGKQNLEIKPDANGRITLRRSILVEQGLVPNLDFNFADFVASDIILQSYRSEDGKYGLVAQLGESLGGGQQLLEGTQRRLSLNGEDTIADSVYEVRLDLHTQASVQTSWFRKFFEFVDVYAQMFYQPPSMELYNLKETVKLNGRLVDVFGHDVLHLSVGGYSEYSQVDYSNFQNFDYLVRHLIYSNDRINRLAFIKENTEFDIGDRFYLQVELNNADNRLGINHTKYTKLFQGRNVVGRILFDIPSWDLVTDFNSANIFIYYYSATKDLWGKMAYKRGQLMTLLRDRSDGDLLRFGKRSHFIRGDFHIDNILASILPLTSFAVNISDNNKNYVGYFTVNDASKMNGGIMPLGDDEPHFVAYPNSEVYGLRPLTISKHATHTSGLSFDFRFSGAAGNSSKPTWNTKLGAGNTTAIDDKYTAIALERFLNQPLTNGQENATVANITRKLLLGFDNKSEFYTYAKTSCLLNGLSLESYLEYKGRDHFDHVHVSFVSPYQSRAQSVNLESYALTRYIEEENRPEEFDINFSTNDNKLNEFNIEGNFNPQTDTLYYYRDVTIDNNGESEIKEKVLTPIPSNANPESELIFDGSKLVYFKRPKYSELIIIRTGTMNNAGASLITCRKLDLNLPIPNPYSEVEIISIKSNGEERGSGPFSIDRGESVSFETQISSPWLQSFLDAGVPIPELQARLTYRLNGNDYIGPSVGISSVNEVVTLTLPTPEMTTSSSIAVFINLVAPGETEGMNEYYGSTGTVIWYTKCEDGQQFSRKLMRCGSTQAPSITCEPVFKESNYSVEGCHRWLTDANWTDSICDPNVVYDCNDRVAPINYYGCPDNEELSESIPAPPSVTIEMEVLYHDYAAETDMTYTNSCTFNFN